VYDEATKSEIACMTGGQGTLTAGHSNRVFSLKFLPEDDNTLVSGGWDNTLQIWDLRVGHSVRGIYGPHVAGDAIDINDRNEILTGSWRPENPLELWDYGSGRRLAVVPWNQSSVRAEPCFLYAAQFSKDASGQQLIAAGGSGSNEAKVFNHHVGNKVRVTAASLSPSGDWNVALMAWIERRTAGWDHRRAQPRRLLAGLRASGRQDGCGGRRLGHPHRRRVRLRAGREDARTARHALHPVRLPSLPFALAPASGARSRARKRLSGLKSRGELAADALVRLQERAHA